MPSAHSARVGRANECDSVEAGGRRGQERAGREEPHGEGERGDDDEVDPDVDARRRGGRAGERADEPSEAEARVQRAEDELAGAAFDGGALAFMATSRPPLAAPSASVASTSSASDGANAASGTARHVATSSVRVTRRLPRAPPIRR